MKASDSPGSPLLTPISYHNEKTKRLQADLQKDLNGQSKEIGLEKDSSNLFRKTKSPHTKIDVRNFTDIIEIDKNQMVATVEGMTTYEHLVNETLKHSCLPAVVPELKTITIGGAIAGCGIESSSFKYGLVHETIEEMDVLLGDASLAVASQTNEHKDLFFGFPNTFGTLGYALKVKVKLVAAKQFVKLTHHRFHDPETYFNAFSSFTTESLKQEGFAFIDGVIFDKNEMYITTGEFVDEAPYTSDYTYLNIYYRSIRERKEDFLTTQDYIWRWDTDWFWCSKVFGMQNLVLRILAGKWMLSSKAYTKIMHYFYRNTRLNNLVKLFQKNSESVIQDVLIPIQNAATFLDFLQKEIYISPIWICPTKAYLAKNHFDFCPLDPNILYLDFGFWDSVPSTKEDGFYNRKIEKMVKKLNGFKSLYSASYYEKDEFWELFNQTQYNKLKRRYDPRGNFKDLFTKCCLK